MQRNQNRSKSPWAFLALAPALLAAPCGGDLLDDASFDLWCGDELCSWVVEQGAVEQAPTWHTEDKGARLVGETVVMSQLSDITEADASCIWLSLLADQETNVNLTVELDFMDDGTVDYEHPVTVTGFGRSDTQILAPERYSGLRVRLRKVGDGDAVIAQIRAQRTLDEDCAGEPIATHALPLGTECDEASECAGGSCSDTSVLGDDVTNFSVVTCGECDADADCEGGQVCGVAWGDGMFPGKTCLDAGSKALGEACTADAECGTGTCHEAQCAECSEDADCGGETCAPNPHYDGDYEGLSPWMCPVGERQSDEACLLDQDCASGVCDWEEPAVTLCNPNGEPCTYDAECRWVDFGATCELIGFSDGTCQ